MAAMMPGPAHKQLAKYVREFTSASKFIMDPAAPAEESAGTSKVSMVMEGRFMLQEDSGTMMGMPYTSLKLAGYNNGSKQYEATWVYTMSTGTMNMTGTASADGKTINWTATFDNEMGAREPLEVVTKFIDDDRFAVILKATGPDGKGGPIMETTYTRKK